MKSIKKEWEGKRKERAQDQIKQKRTRSSGDSFPEETRRKY